MTTLRQPRLIKLDGRYSGYPDFKYAIEFSRNIDYPEFNQMRKTLWEHFGASCEQEHWWEHGNGAAWAWTRDQFRTRIFLREQAYTWYKLKYT